MQRIWSLLNTQVCPWWLCPAFDNPVRRLLQNPQAILGGLVAEGETALDLGCGMGYFTIPLAQMVGARGGVIAVDLQPQMLERVRQRARRAGVEARLRLHQGSPESIGLSDTVDFALAFWMLHEVRDPLAFLREVRGLMLPGGRMLLAEPVVHVSEAAFRKTIDTAQSSGFSARQARQVRWSHAVLLEAI